MKLYFVTLFLCLLWASPLYAAPSFQFSDVLDLLPRSSSSNKGGSKGNHNHACSGNTARDRSVWCDYSINTDYETVAPDTGVTREYWLDIKQVTLAPDGYSRPVWTINGTMPGPTLFADWGDWVVIHVTNNLAAQRNGTTIHWHGIRQNYTNQDDGVPSITQCPIAPGSTMTYKWRAVQYGSTWYHSHVGLLAWEGIYGGLVINGPATANYDVDLGALFLGDWTHRTVDELYLDQEMNGPVNNLTNGLINGTNIWVDPNGRTTGKHFTMGVKQGKSYRLRLINPAIDTFWKFSIDGHTLEVIAADLVPIVPYKTEAVGLAMGKSYFPRITFSVTKLTNFIKVNDTTSSSQPINNESPTHSG